MVQRVKDLTAAAGVTAKAQTGSITGLAQWVKELALLQLWSRSQLWLRFDPWPGDFRLALKSKRKKRNTLRDTPKIMFG